MNLNGFRHGQKVYALSILCVLLSLIYSGQESIKKKEKKCNQQFEGTV